MSQEWLTQLVILMWGVTTFSAIVFLISGLDDLFFDIYYWCYACWRLIFLRRANKLSYEKLAAKPEQRIAIMVPCWHEAGVIEDMLRYNIYHIDYEYYDIFVGVYPNDPHTIASVASIEKELPHVHHIINDKPGPTNKSDNLNTIYHAISAYEKKHHIEYSIFVLHDSEDMIHALSLKLYNYLMPKNAMVQVPIFPMTVPLYELTHWTYATEFSEIHTKDIIVREHIGGLVPSAGVGTAFSRDCLQHLKDKRQGMPFSINTLTEDYHTALEIKLSKMRQIFALQYVYRTVWRKKYLFFGPAVACIKKQAIATEAMFPMSYRKAVNQKTRWIYGITFQEWMNTGWQGRFAILYTLLHDRKSIITHFVSGLFYLTTVFWLIYAIYIFNHPLYASFQDFVDAQPLIWILIVVASFFMLNRVLQRMIAVWRIYGWLPALTTMPLVFYTNLINLHALLRAYHTFIFGPKKKGLAGPAWDKTDHTFPKRAPIGGYNIRLGDLLVRNKLINKQDLKSALSEHGKTGQKLGHVLLDRQLLTEGQLLQFLAQQHGIRLIKDEQIKSLAKSAIPLLTAAQYQNLITHHNLPIQVAGDRLTVVIHDPSNDIELANVIRWTQPYHVDFVMRTHSE